MNKTLVIAQRDYFAAVKSKGFIIGLVLMPVMMFGSVIVSRLTKDIVDVTDKRVVVLDRTPDAAIYSVLSAASEKRNTDEIFEKENRRQRAAKFVFEIDQPADINDERAVSKQREQLSEQIRKGEIFAFIEVGQDLFTPTETAPPTAADADEIQKAVARLDIDAVLDKQAKLQGDNNIVRYYTNRPTYGDVKDFVQKVVTNVVIPRRMAGKKVDWDALAALAKPPLVSNQPLFFKESSGAVKQESKQGQFMSFILPLAMLLLMFIVVLIGASQLATNVVEEKQLRIAEVLLGSCRPFDLMMGKLLGGVGVALTLAAVYIIGAFIGAREFGISKYLTPSMIAWFVTFVVMAVFLYGGMFVAAGAAVTNIKEAQSLITPIMLVVMLPMFFFGQLINDPTGLIARVLTFFPFSSPMVTVMRLGVPPGLKLWECFLAAGITLVTTIAIVWAAGRIFRVGILMQGQPAKPAQIIKWIFSGS